MNIYSPPPQFSPPPLPPFIPMVSDFSSLATSIDLTEQTTYQSSAYLTPPIVYYDKDSPVRTPWAVYENYGEG